MNTIKVINVETHDKTLYVKYEISDKLEHYFTAERVMEIEYSEDISTVPESVLVIPFVCNVLPIAWLADAELEIPVLDREFYEGIPDVLEGYRNMSPMLTFKGSVKVARLEDNSYQPTNATAAFFSGGVDAFATLVAHKEEQPQLITLWGADIKLNDIKGWERVNAHVQNVSKQFNLPQPLIIRSNFRTIIFEHILNGLVKASGENWWYGYQHGIGIIGHAAPIAYLKHWKTAYFASTNTINDKLICASDPSIDNKLRLINTRVCHDQYEFTRQQKVQHVVESCHSGGTEIRLRVCWQSVGGGNCCRCEKCVRTIYAILAEGANPAEYGFTDWKSFVSYYPDMIRTQLHEVEHLRTFWQAIQNKLRASATYEADTDTEWLYTLDVNNSLTWRLKLKKAIKFPFIFAKKTLRFLKRKLLNK